MFQHSKRQDCSMWVKCGCCLLICVAVNAIEVDVMGAVNVGKKVVEALSLYLKEDLLQGHKDLTRRSSNPHPHLESLTTTILNTKFCTDENKVCSPKFEAFLNDYILSLTNIVASVFEGVLEDESSLSKIIIKSIALVKKVINEPKKPTDEVQLWTNVLKKCNAFFLGNVLELSNHTSVNIKEITHSKIILRQRFIIRSAALENDYLNRMCKEFHFCPFQYHASINFQEFLSLVKTMNDTKVFTFINEFRKTFLRSPMIKELDEKTRKNFQDTLNEMTVIKTIGRETILSIAGVVQKRISHVEFVEKDELVVHMILSDLDHMYVNFPGEPIEHFMDGFIKWLKSNEVSDLSSSMESLYVGLASLFNTKDPELVSKLTAAAQVFLELAVGPSYA